MGAHEAVSNLGESGKRGELWLVLWTVVLGWMVVGLSLAVATTGSTGNREAFFQRLDGGSVGEGLLCGSPGQILIKGGSPWFQSVYCHGKM